MGQIDDGLKRVEGELGIPYESMLAVMFAESGLHPDARNPKDTSKPIAAAGLIQLTKGANLAGFHTNEDIERVLTMSIPEQFEQIVLPYYRRIPGARGASPGRLRMLNFLSEHANEGEDFVLGTRQVDENGKLIGDSIYHGNWGFDPGSKGATGGKGFITVGDVYDNTAHALVGAKAYLAAHDPPSVVPASSPTPPSSPAAGPVLAPGEVAPHLGRSIAIGAALAVLAAGAAWGIKRARR